MTSDDHVSGETSTDMSSEFSYETETNSSYTDIYFDDLANVLNVYYTPILITLGTAGNLVSIIVFHMRKLRVQSTSQYLTALAISDILFLWQLVPPWLNAVQVSSVFTQAGFCQSFVYLSYVSSSHSSWLVVAFTLERFVAVLYPLQRSRMCTVRRARTVILALAVASLLINLPVLRFAVPSTNDCNIDHELIVHAARFNVVDTIISFTLPLGIITVLNVWIAIGVFRLSRDRGRLIKEENTQIRARTDGDTPRNKLASQRQRARSSLHRSQQRITTMLLIVSSVFVLLNMPAYVMRIAAYANNMSSYNGRWAALQQICLLFFNTNFGINFFLYCMTGQNFRRALVQTFPCLRRLRRSLKMTCCCCHYCRTNEQEPLVRPSISNSISINTEAATNNTAASAMNLNNDDVTRRQRLRRSRQYVRRWRFDNSRQQHNVTMNNEMESLPAQQPPAPLISDQMNPTGPVHFGHSPIMISPLTVWPIPTRPESWPLKSTDEAEPSQSDSWPSHVISRPSRPVYALSDNSPSATTARIDFPPAPASGQMPASGTTGSNNLNVAYSHDLYLYSPISVCESFPAPIGLNYITTVRSNLTQSPGQSCIVPVRASHTPLFGEKFDLILRDNVSSPIDNCIVPVRESWTPPPPPISSDEGTHVPPGAATERRVTPVIKSFVSSRETTPTIAQNWIPMPGKIPVSKEDCPGLVPDITASSLTSRHCQCQCPCQCHYDMLRHAR